MVRAVDEFLEPYWNLEQVRSWAETRYPEAIRFAAIPKEGIPKLGSQVASFCFHAATALARNGRDVGAELWAASGWTPPALVFEPPQVAQKVADEIGFPRYRRPFNKDIQINLPKRAHTDELLALWTAAPDSERALMANLAQAYSDNGKGFSSDPRIPQLSAELRNAASDYFSAPEPHGPPNVFVRGTFPTIQYLEHLFRTGELTAIANLPGDPRAYELSKGDWAGLEIACSGDLQRLGVWRIGKVRATGEGDFENLRVERDAVLRLFPAEPPAISRSLAAVEPPVPRPIGTAPKPTKVDAAKEALKRIYPGGRPPQSYSELRKTLNKEAPEIGEISPRTLSEAIALAWPVVKQN
jgi:hypothetical protein